MSVSSGSDITIPIQDSPPPPPSPYAGSNKKGDKTTTDNITIIDTTGVAHSDSNKTTTSGKKTPEPRGDVTVTVGFVNEAYQDHSPDHPNEKKQNGKGNNNGAISISVAGAGDEKKEKQNGSSNGNGDTTMEVHLNEAVNPELINMNILNTIPEKPNPEYGPYDNMDEYFVPVNQHKKFLRSEKLYVTKDKRKETRWKKYVCWLIGAAITATIITVAVLAGIGLIPQKSPNNFDTESVVGTESSSGDSFTLSTSPDSSQQPSSMEINTPPTVPVDATYEKTELEMIYGGESIEICVEIPLAADINFHITDLSYEPALNDKTSERFQTLSTEIQDEVKAMLKDKAGLANTNSRVMEFAPGSVYVKMRIGWVDQSMDFNHLKMMLSNVTSVGPYNIMPISSYEVVNHCKFNKNGCTHNCSYNYTAMDFYCFCKDTTYYLDEDKKTCISIYEVTSHSPSTTTTTSEVPFVPSVSSEEVPPSSSSPSAIETDYYASSSQEPIIPSEEHVSQEEEFVPTEPEQEHHHHQNEETSSMSHEHHASEGEHHDTHFVPESSTTSAPVSSSEEPVSEEVVEREHNHHHDLGLPVSAPETTTTTANPMNSSSTEGPIGGLSSEEEVISEHAHTEQPRQASEEEETTSLPIVPISSSSPSSVSSEEPIHQSHEQNLGRTDVDNDEIVHPTEITPESKSQEQPESEIVHLPATSSSGENVTLTGSVSEEHDHLVPESEDDFETTVAPPLPSASSSSGENHSVGQSEQVDHEHFVPASEETPTTVLPVAAGVSQEDENEATTITAGRHEEPEQPHGITPLDVLGIHAYAQNSSGPAEPVSNHFGGDSRESPVGRSVSGEDHSVESVAQVHETNSTRSESLTKNNEEEEQVTETGFLGMGMESDDEDGEGERQGRLYSNEMTNAMRFDGEEEDKSREREELAAPLSAQEGEQLRSNVTDSASVELETADENPAIASGVTSDEAASRESSTNAGIGSSESSSPVSEEPARPNSGSASSEFSQESPVLVSSVESTDDENSGERTTTFPPKSLIHDVDVNYVGNRTSDDINTESVSEEKVSGSIDNDAEHIEGANDAVQLDKEKLVVAEPNNDEDEMMEATTTVMSPVVIEIENKTEKNAPDTESQIAPENSGSAETQPEADPVQIPIPSKKSESEEEHRHEPEALPVPVPSNSENEPATGSESQETNSDSGLSTSSRSVVSPLIEAFDRTNDESFEHQNRDHRHTEEDLSSPGSYSGSTESVELTGDHFDKLVEEMETTGMPSSEQEEQTPNEVALPSTSTTTTTTQAPEATSTSSAPIPEASSEEVTTTTSTAVIAPQTTTTTTEAADTSNVNQTTVSNPSTPSAVDISVKKGEESMELGSLSMEGLTNSQHSVENGHDFSSPEFTSGSGGSASSELGNQDSQHFPSEPSSLGDNSSSDNDLGNDLR